MSDVALAEPPMLADRLLRRDDHPGTGRIPQELKDLMSSKYRYVHSRNGSEPKLEVQRAMSGEGVDGWRIAVGGDVSEGIPVLSGEFGTAEEFSGEDDPAGGNSHRPDWITLSYHPRPAPVRVAHRLKRRNGASVVPELVIGNDDRMPFYPILWPWCCVGKIDVWLAWAGTAAWEYAWSGTGTLVGRNVVLTARHVFPWWAEQLNVGMLVRFTPAYYDGNSALGESVYSYAVNWRGYLSGDEQGDDMIVLKLGLHLGDSLGYFGYMTYKDDWEGHPYWTHIGYPGMIEPDRPSRQSNIIVIDDDSGGAGVELEHTGDTSPGNSGGPLWGWWKDGTSPRVIGTHSGTEDNWDETNSVAAGGPALSKLIKWARTNW